MTANELCARLSISRQQLNGYVRHGLPVERKPGKPLAFAPSAVLDWLHARGLARRKSGPAPTPATPPPAIVKTIADVARHFAVHRRSVNDWKSEGMPVAAHGYDLTAIARWLEAKQQAARTGGNPARAEKQDELLDIRVETERLNLAAKRANLVDASVVAAHNESTINEAKALLAEFPGLFAAALPPDFSDDLKRLGQQIARETLDRVYEALANMAEGKIES